MLCCSFLLKNKLSNPKIWALIWLLLPNLTKIWPNPKIWPLIWPFLENGQILTTGPNPTLLAAMYISANSTQIQVGYSQMVTKDDPQVTKDEPRVTQHDPWLTQNDHGCTQDDPRVTLRLDRVTPGWLGLSLGDLFLKVHSGSFWVTCNINVQSQTGLRFFNSQGPSQSDGPVRSVSDRSIQSWFNYRLSLYC